MQDIMGSFLPVCVLLALVFVAGLAAWRFFTLRSKGNAVIARRLPAKGTHGWRHGRIVCDGQQLNMYKLRSLSPSADVILERQELTLHRQRSVTDAEGSFMSSSLQVLEVSTPDDHFELAVDNATAMALCSWLESAPDSRQERYKPQRLR
ncbi:MULTISPECIES: DUF2550 domain-containing protein [Corynebacterium]|uniref:DUF2550 domain-containing protein n=2 Tax=Corynebacterium pseudodiphtheriticum TaxID=37637 RepID=A0AAP4F4L5_9CORY|nr:MULTISPECIES: DUF2550 domain-containing protein [Corynebacterium]ERS38699.1 hypothetical protein HMPREF1292_01881 [Corynebacterium sp. KPL1995]ERS71221.1 hypothetical protein HMPREF1290_01999 [Corynebacterium sp. KPL1989]MCG7252402.1 DUF2550 domain-containing protein [Corynebacterium pseudodiphtheriticum]MDC7085573.1 DUF2550 domain-containing protein [Corynebacterium pseudodiphtheriticum]MDK4242757.1 DUF2550 domain-containing protein [Corynebacterium pseudodiphtheriticum]